MSELQWRLGGRPSKRTQEILAAYEVINRDNNALIYTDAELLFAINEKLSSTGLRVRPVERDDDGTIEPGADAVRLTVGP